MEFFYLFKLFFTLSLSFTNNFSMGVRANRANIAAETISQNVVEKPHAKTFTFTFTVSRRLRILSYAQLKNDISIKIAQILKIDQYLFFKQLKYIAQKPAINGINDNNA